MTDIRFRALVKRHLISNCHTIIVLRNDLLIVRIRAFDQAA